MLDHLSLLCILLMVQTSHHQTSMVIVGKIVIILLELWIASHSIINTKFLIHLLINLNIQQKILNLLVITTISEDIQMELTLEIMIFSNLMIMQDSETYKIYFEKDEIYLLRKSDYLIPSTYFKICSTNNFVKLSFSF